MARSIWKGSITFGLVNIPVGLFSAEKREETVSFHMLDRRNMARLRYKRVNEKTGREVPWEETVRGYEIEGGKHVVLSDEDLERASPEKTQTIDILDFVDAEEISPVFFDKPYYLGPDKKGVKSYALLRETLRRTNKVGVAKVVIRTKQYLAAVLVEGDAIVLNVLRFAHELRETDELNLPSGKEGVSERELDMAERLVEGMVSSWEPEKYRDDYYKDLKKLIKDRVDAGQLEESPEAPPKPKAEPGAKVVDLMALLKQSVEEKPGRKPAHKAARKPAKKAARKPARKTASKRKSA